jgi:hypothetical protein
MSTDMRRRVAGMVAHSTTSVFACGSKNRFNSFAFAAKPQKQTKKKARSWLPQAKTLWDFRAAF